MVFSNVIKTGDMALFLASGAARLQEPESKHRGLIVSPLLDAMQVVGNQKLTLIAS